MSKNANRSPSSSKLEQCFLHVATVPLAAKICWSECVLANYFLYKKLICNILGREMVSDSKSKSSHNLSQLMFSIKLFFVFTKFIHDFNYLASPLRKKILLEKNLSKTFQKYCWKLAENNVKVILEIFSILVAISRFFGAFNFYHSRRLFFSWKKSSEAFKVKFEWRIFKVWIYIVHKIREKCSNAFKWSKIFPYLVSNQKALDWLQLKIFPIKNHLIIKKLIKSLEPVNETWWIQKTQQKRDRDGKQR